jgi:hypothetical protein
VRLGQFVGECLNAISSARAEQQSCALRCKGMRARLSNAGTGAGDKDDFIAH